jgi:hypothetical protein
MALPDGLSPRHSDSVLPLSHANRSQPGRHRVSGGSARRSDGNGRRGHHDAFLISAVGVGPIVAVGTDLVYSAATKIVGAWLHARQRTVDFRLVKRLAMGSVPAGLLAVAAIRLLPGAGVDADQAVRRGSSAPMCFTQRFWSARPALPTPMAAVLTGFLPRLSCSDRFRVSTSAPG